MRYGRLRCAKRTSRYIEQHGEWFHDQAGRRVGREGDARSDLRLGRATRPVDSPGEGRSSSRSRSVSILVLDAGALIALERNSRPVWALVEAVYDAGDRAPRTGVRPSRRCGTASRPRLASTRRPHPPGLMGTSPTVDDGVFAEVVPTTSIRPATGRLRPCNAVMRYTEKSVGQRSENW